MLPEAAAFPACSPLAALLLAGAGSPAGSQGPAETPALRPSSRSSPALPALAVAAARMCTAEEPRAIAVVSWKQAGSASSPLSLSLAFFLKKDGQSDPLYQTYPRLKSAGGKTFNSARSAGSWFACVSVSLLKSQP